MNTCKDCRFYDAVGRGAGLCRKTSPLIDFHDNDVDTRLEAVWPETYPGDWCGEFQSAKTAEPKKAKLICNVCHCEADILDSLGQHPNYIRHEDSCVSRLLAKLAAHGIK